MNQTTDADDDATDRLDDRDTAEYDHLDDLSDGAGCTEIWEHLSDSREDPAASD